MRATERLTGASFNAVRSLLIRGGKVAIAYHDQHVRDVPVRQIQCDEIWSFIYAKRKNVEFCLTAPRHAGDIWTWTALDAKSKLILSYHVGHRTEYHAKIFLRDVASRVRPRKRIQVTTDGFPAYQDAVPSAFGRHVDFAQLVKDFSVNGGTRKVVRNGYPYPPGINTSYVERQNLNMRMSMRRFMRKTNGFSKKLAHHAYMVALYAWHYNFCWIHGTHGLTPAMAAGIDTRLLDIGWMVDVIRAHDPLPGPRGPYKSRRCD